MADCMKKTIDVFVTHEAPTTYDEVWQGPVWSVEISGLTTAALAGGALTLDAGNSSDDVVAYVANWATPWIMTAYQDWQPYTLDVGDLVRVGDVGSNGYTDYLTVVERVRVDKLTNGIATMDIGWCTSNQGLASPSAPQIDNLKRASHENAPSAPYEWSREAGATGQRNFIDLTSGTYYAYRLNYSINATNGSPPIEMRGLTVDREKRILETRHLLEINKTWADSSKRDWPERTERHERWMKKRHFPLYKVTPPPAMHKVSLDRGVKAVHSIKLYGATFVNKRQIGFQNAHEFHTDDWVAVNLREVQGEVISNNEAANGAFAILHTGHTNDAHTGAVEIHEREMAGLATVIFERPRTDMRSLTVELRDRLGQPAHLGRIHLWFKLCVSHG